MELVELDRSLEYFVKSLLLIVWRRIIIFIITAASIFAIIIIGMLAVHPVYEGATLLIGNQTGLDQNVGTVRKPVETQIALTRIAESQEVVAAAVQSIGLDKLLPDRPATTQSFFARLRRLVFPSKAEPEGGLSLIDAALPRIQLGLSVRSESNSDIIRIAYRHRDPEIAANFANAVAQAFVNREVLLYSKPGAAAFFQRQQQRFEDEAKQAALDFHAFSTRTAVYAATDQRQLLLKRLNEMEAGIAVSRGTISQKLAERQTLADELRKLAPVTRSSYVTGLVDTLGGDRTAPGPRSPDARAMDDRAADPPLLLVRVYQDSMVALFKINADLAAAQGLQREQSEEVASLNSELRTLSSREEEFTRLERAIDRARYNADVYSKRMVEEQINAESSTARFSSSKVLQKATVPLRPVSPKYVMLSIMAAGLSLMGGLSVAYLTRRRA